MRQCLWKWPELTRVPSGLRKLCVLLHPQGASLISLFFLSLEALASQHTQSALAGCLQAVRDLCGLAGMQGCMAQCCPNVQLNRMIMSSAQNW